MPNQELETEYERVIASIGTFQQHATELARRLGKEVPTDIAAKHREQDDDVTLYDRMTPAEVMDLYTSDREKWSRMMDAKEQQGLRKLFGR